MRIFSVFSAIPNPRVNTLFLTCVDPHFEEVWNGLPGTLGLKSGEYASIKIAGGPIPLAYPNECKSRAKCAAGQLLFARDKFPGITRCVLIVHESCAYYCTIPSHRSGKEDLALAGSLVKALVPQWDIELQYATYINGGQTIQLVEIAPSEQIIRPPSHWFKYHRQTA